MLICTSQSADVLQFVREYPNSVVVHIDSAAAIGTPHLSIEPNHYKCIFSQIFESVLQHFVTQSKNLDNGSDIRIMLELCRPEGKLVDSVPKLCRTLTKMIRVLSKLCVIETTAIWIIMSHAEVCVIYRV